MRLAVGSDYFPIGRRHRVADDDPFPPGNAAGHQHGFGQAGSAVVHTGVGDFHTVKRADHRLELKDDLQRALRHFRLVRGIGRQKLAPRHQRLDDGGDEVVIRPGAQKRGAAAQRAIAAGQFAQLPLYLQLRKRSRQVERRIPIAVGNVAEQVVNAAQPDGGQQLILLNGSVGNVMGLKRSGHRRGCSIIRR